MTTTTSPSDERRRREDTGAVLEVLIGFLEGHHYGDGARLSATLGPAGQDEDPRRGRLLRHVPAEPAPADQGEPFRYRILDVAIDGAAAAATLRPLPYGDGDGAVTLRKSDGAWRIDGIKASGAACGP